MCKAGLEIGLINVLPHSHSLGRFPSFHSGTKKESKIFNHWGPREREKKKGIDNVCVTCVFVCTFEQVYTNEFDA